MRSPRPRAGGRAGDRQRPHRGGGRRSRRGAEVGDRRRGRGLRRRPQRRRRRGGLAARYPGVEILVNNLGIFEPKPFEEIPDADWLRFFDVNVLSGVRLARLYLPAMRRANWGRIIFISSESAMQIPAEMIHYGMTKTAQIAVSRGLAEAVAGTGITVNSVLPGPTQIARRRRFRREPRRSGGQVVRGVREGVLREGPADVADQALRDAGGGGVAGGLCREPARLGDDRRGAARRRRRGEEHGCRAQPEAPEAAALSASGRPLRSRNSSAAGSR